MGDFSEIEVENIPVEFNGKIVGKARLRTTGRLEMDFSNADFDGDVTQILSLGLVTGIQLDFSYIPAVKKIVQQR